MPPTAPPTDELPAVADTNGVHSPPEPEPEGAEAEFSEEFLARLRELDWLDGEYNAGRLAQYYGEYVISANHTILAHDVFQDRALGKAEVEARRLGIPIGLLTSYSIPSIDYPMRVE